ncbi:hypothetical protein IMSAG192_01242 [Muribaculaceae bacterium]|nr:hypothetical protein IMSAG192_01242 [Muribaculaceae bacterium]
MDTFRRLDTIMKNQPHSPASTDRMAVERYAEAIATMGKKMWMSEMSRYKSSKTRPMTTTTVSISAARESSNGSKKSCNR